MLHYDISISQDAINDLTEIFDYIAINVQEPETASTIVGRVYASIISLKTMPLRFALAKDSFLAGQGFRVMPVGSYLIIYAVDEALNKVIVHRVVHAKRNYKKLFCIMRYENLINELFIQFPMLKVEYEKEGDYIKGLQHLVFSIIFVPFIKQTCLANDEDKLQSICDFMESMAISEEVLVSELLVVSVLENILDEREMIHSLRQYFGSQTIEYLTALERTYGWEE